MSILTNLKLVTAKKNHAVSPTVGKRLKLCAKLKEQAELVAAEQAGGVYAPKRLKTVTDKQTGERRTVETVKRVKPWHWLNDGGKINLAVKYGAKTMTLAKGGKNCIELASSDELVPTLNALIDAAIAGELDEAIAAASAATRTAFGK